MFTVANEVNHLQYHVSNIALPQQLIIIQLTSCYKAADTHHTTLHNGQFFKCQQSGKVCSDGWTAQNNVQRG